MSAVPPIFIRLQNPPYCFLTVCPFISYLIIWIQHFKRLMAVGPKTHSSPPLLHHLPQSSSQTFQPQSLPFILLCLSSTLSFSLLPSLPLVIVFVCSLQGLANVLEKHAGTPLKPGAFPMRIGAQWREMNQEFGGRPWIVITVCVIYLFQLGDGPGRSSEETI